MGLESVRIGKENFTWQIYLLMLRGHSSVRFLVKWVNEESCVTIVSYYVIATYSFKHMREVMISVIFLTSSVFSGSE